jgi:serine/alanine adding enzyme
MLKTTVDAAQPSDAIVVSVCDDCARWDEYVSGRASSGLYHNSGWKEVFSSYRLPCFRLTAICNGRVVGVLPLVRQRSLMFGDKLVSLPWFDSSGILSDDEVVTRSLLERTLQMARDCGVEGVELRQQDRLDVGGEARTDKVLMRLALPSNPEELWSTLKAKVRNQIRKAQKCGLTADCGGVELLDDFYRVYSHNMRDLGSPAHHRRFFRSVWDVFSEKVCIYRVRLGEKTVGAGWTMANGDVLEIPWASTLRKHNGLCVNNLLYWTMLEDACRHKFRYFHFGRSSRDSGTYRFKKQWGAEEVPLYWYWLTREGAALPSGDPKSSYGWAIRAWQHLPLPIAELLGPQIISKVS